VMAELEQDIAEARAKGLALSVDGASSQPAVSVEDADAEAP
jgi:hypothetical protein